MCMILSKKHGVYHSIDEAIANPRTNMYVTGSDAQVYHLRNTGVLSICKKARNVPAAPSLREGVRFQLPKIPWVLLTEFIRLARFYAVKHNVEVHGEIYWDEKNYHLYIPEQVVQRELVEPNSDVNLELEYTKVMEIHSHHYMEAIFSKQDDESEQQPILYAVVGHIGMFFPAISVRTCLDGEHVYIHPGDIFESPMALTNNEKELKQITVKKEAIQNDHI